MDSAELRTYDGKIIFANVNDGGYRCFVLLGQAYTIHSFEDITGDIRLLLRPFPRTKINRVKQINLRDYSIEERLISTYLNNGLSRLVVVDVKKEDLAETADLD